MTPRPVLFFLLLTAVSPATAPAQSVAVGIKAGVSSAHVPGYEAFFARSLEPSRPAENQALVAFTGGAFIEVSLGRGFALQPEAMYVRKGWQGEFPLDGQRGGSRLVVDLLDVSVLVRFAGAGPSRAAWYVAGGPAFGFAAAHDLQIRPSAEAPWESVPDCVCTFLERTDVGIVLAGGLMLGRILIEGRWEEGLKDLIDLKGLVSDDRSTSALESARTRVFSVLAGLRF